MPKSPTLKENEIKKLDIIRCKAIKYILTNLKQGKKIIQKHIEIVVGLKTGTKGKDKASEKS